MSENFGTTTEEIPRKGSHWIYEGAKVVVMGVRTIVDWKYESENKAVRYSDELKSFQEGGAFTPVPIEVKAGQTWTSPGDCTFIVSEVFEEVAFGRSNYTDYGWEPESVSCDILINNENWSLVEGF